MINDSEYKPYTYLIGWSKYNKWYLGCEYSKGRKIANPKNLWKIYFTSSKDVQKFRQLYGEPDIIEVLYVFTTKEEALLSEEYLLKSVNIKEDKWINRHNRGLKFLPIKRIGMTR